MRKTSHKVQLAPWLCLLSTALALCLALTPIAALADETTALQNPDEEQYVPATEDQPSLTTTISIENITETGDVILPFSSSEMLKTFGYFDTVTVSFLDQALDLRVSWSASHAEDDSTIFYVPRDQGPTLAIKAGDFATTYGIAT